MIKSFRFSSISMIFLIIILIIKDEKIIEIYFYNYIIVILYQNYPNPFNPSTKIKYEIPSNVKSETSNVKLIIYDILGNQMAVLVNNEQKPGIYEIEWNANNDPSGVYYYKLTAGNYSETKAMILIK